jgi:hypothetical protein
VSDHREKLQLVRGYLEEEFRDHTVTALALPASSAPGYAVEQAGRRYEVQVDRDFLDQHSARDIGGLLAQWKLRDELCRAEGLPVILTARGVRLVSGN